MKPFMGIDLTANKKNEEYNDAPWLEQATSAATVQLVEDAVVRSLGTVEKSELPLALRIVKIVCGYGGLLIALGILRSMMGEDAISLTQAYQNAAWLFWLGGACIVIWGILQIKSMKKQKEVLESEEGTQTFSHLESSMDAALTELGVPSDACEVDILSFYYKEKDGEIKVQEKMMALAPYTTMIFHLFSDEEKIYLANAEAKYAFSRTAIRSIETVKKSVRADTWNKDEEYNKGQYKQYKITTDNYDCIHFKPYHILHLDKDGEEWGIYFGCYDLSAFEAATGLKAQ